MFEFVSFLSFMPLNEVVWGIQTAAQKKEAIRSSQFGLWVAVMCFFDILQTINLNLNSEK